MTFLCSEIYQKFQWRWKCNNWIFKYLKFSFLEKNIMSKFSDFNKDLCIGGSDCSRFVVCLVYFVRFIFIHCTSVTNKWTGRQAGSFQMNMTWIIYGFCSINQCNLLGIFYQVWSTRVLVDMSLYHYQPSQSQPTHKLIILSISLLKIVSEVKWYLYDMMYAQKCRFFWL